MLKPSIHLEASWLSIIQSLGLKLPVQDMSKSLSPAAFNGSAETKTISGKYPGRIFHFQMKQMNSRICKNSHAYLKVRFIHITC